MTNTLGSYFDNTVTFLTDDCGVGAYSVATGKAVVYGIGGGLWGAGKATMYGALHYSGSLEGVVIYEYVQANGRLISRIVSV